MLRWTCTRYRGRMFVRRTQTRRTEDGQPYFSHRLVHSERIGNAVRQRTLLNLGRHFDIPQAQWPLLCSRIDDILAGQTPLVPDCPTAVEHEAQRIAAQLVARGTPVQGPAAGPTDIQPVDVDSLRLVRPRSVGVEQVGLWALEQLGLPALLTEFGCQRRAAHRGGRRRRRAPGPAGLGARDAPLAANPQRSRRVARRRLRDRQPDAALSRLGRAGKASRADRGASVRPRHGTVRPAADGHPLRPDQHLFRKARRARSRRPGAGTRKRSAATVRC